MNYVHILNNITFFDVFPKTGDYDRKSPPSILYHSYMYMYEIGDIASVRDPRCIISPYSSWVKYHTHDRLIVELDEWKYSAYKAQNTVDT